MAVATRLVKDIGSDEPLNHHEQSRRLDLRSPGGQGQALRRTKGEPRDLPFSGQRTNASKLFGERQSLVDDLFQLFGAGRQRPGLVGKGRTGPKVLVRDVEGG